MTTSPNPFADDPQPAGELRLQSAADPLNPYAAPVGVAEGRKHDPGIGLWRDGKYLVLHLQAEFPPRCVYTNEPAESFRTQNLGWHYPIDYSRRKLRLHFGVSETQQHYIARARWIRIMLALLCALPGIIVWLVASNWGFFDAVPLVLIFSGVATVIAIDQVRYVGYPFKFHKAKESYLWLAGANPAFLNSLPAWPGVG